jgi:chemotaxis protein CheD
MPGDVVLGRAGDAMRTLLGSCVAVILTDPRRTVGAMCHIVHAGRPSHAHRHDTTYGVVAMDEMFRRLTSVGITARLCQAFVYGGGNMFPDRVADGGVGSRNVQWVMRFLHEHHIQMVDCATEGDGCRKVSWVVGPTPPQVEMMQVARGGGHAD